MFYIAQIFGIIALIVLVLSFQKNDKDTLLKYQILSSLFFAIQYLFLNAISGCLMNTMTLIRNLIFRKFKNKIPLIYLIIVIFLMIILSIFSYNGPISLLPATACIIYSIAIWQSNMTIARVAEVIACVLSAIYNVKVLAISGLISIIIEIISVLIAIYRYDIKKYIPIKEVR